MTTKPEVQCLSQLLIDCHLFSQHYITKYKFDSFVGFRVENSPADAFLTIIKVPSVPDIGTTASDQIRGIGLKIDVKASCET